MSLVISTAFSNSLFVFAFMGLMISLICTIVGSLYLIKVIGLKLFIKHNLDGVIILILLITFVLTLMFASVYISTWYK